MTEPSMGLEVGPIILHWYSLLVVLGLGLGSALAYVRARRLGEDPEPLVDFLTWGIILALVVARLFYVWNPPPSIASYYDRAWYLSHPLDLQTGVVAIWSGGLGSAGGLLGMLLGFGYVLWRYELPVRRWARIVLPALLLTLAITPWGNLLIRQMVGKPTSLPWGMVIDPWPAGYEQPGVFPEGATGFHPLPAYLSLWALLCLAAYFALDFVDLRWFDDFDVLIPPLLYVVGLFVLDFLRLDVNYGLLGLTGMQWMALGLILIVGAWGVIRNRFVSIKRTNSLADGTAQD